MLRPIQLSKLINILLFIILFSAILFFGRDFLILITFAAFLAMLLTPFSNRLERGNFSRIVSSIISVLIIIIVFSAITWVLSSQIKSFIQDLPKIRSEFEGLIDNIHSWIYREFDTSIEKQVSTVKDHAAEAVAGAGGFLAGVVKGIFTLLGSLLLVLVFTFLFLLHREKYEDFIVMLHKEEKRMEAREVIDEITKISEQYLIGRMVAVVMMAIIYLAGFLLIGLKNGVVLALIAALIAFVPYVGSIIGGFVPLLMSVVEGSLNQAIWVLIITVLVNVISHYVIEPYVVGGSVNISPFFTIFSLIVGGVFWGLAGIILFLPMLGILKITFENIEGLHPYAFLIGDQDDSSVHEKLWLMIKSWFSKNN